MNLGTLKEIVAQAISEHDGSMRIRPSWVASRAVRLADPERDAPEVVEFAANLEFRQIARDRLRNMYEPENPAEQDSRQHALFPGLQAMYPRKVGKDEEPEYVSPELLSDDDARWNISRMRAGADTLLQGADALEAYIRERALRRLQIGS